MTDKEREFWGFPADTKTTQPPLISPTTQPPGTYSMVRDCKPLMLAIAELAGCETMGVSRMVLVLDVNDVPRLYLNSYMRFDKSKVDPDSPELPPTEIVIEHIGDANLPFEVRTK